MSYPKYFDLRQELIDTHRSNKNDDDVLDVFVEMTADDKHYTDEELENVLFSYRQYEKAFPEFVKKANGFVRS